VLETLAGEPTAAAVVASFLPAMSLECWAGLSTTMRRVAVWIAWSPLSIKA
jgi:hypothetical protein